MELYFNMAAFIWYVNQLLFVIVQPAVNTLYVRRNKMLKNKASYTKELKDSNQLDLKENGQSSSSGKYFFLVFTKATYIHFRELWLAPVTCDIQDY